MNDNIHTASGVAREKNVRVRALDRGACLKRKLHFPSQTDSNWKPINGFATRLGRQMEAAHDICTRVGAKNRDLCIGNWNVTSLNGKEKKLVWEAEQYHFDIVGVSSAKCRGFDTVELNEGWKLST